MRKKKIRKEKVRLIGKISQAVERRNGKERRRRKR
jgi:hypothetical protein